MGRFTALEDSDDDPELDGSDHDDEEAPYAYVARLSAPVNVSGMDAKDCDPADGLDSRQGGAALDVLPRELTTDSQGYFPNGQSQQALPQVRGEEVSGSASDTNMLSVEDTDLSSYVGSSQPSCTQSPASIPGSEFPFSLDSELNQASTPVAVEEPKSSTRTEGDNSTETGVLLNSGPAHAQTPSLSQEGFSIEGTKPAPGMPQQLPTFLIPFSGSLIKVPANGQCAYAALYASTTASAEPRLQFTSEVVKDANIIKRSIYTLMMINLANDVECKVVDPCRELKRLYPSQPAPLDVAVATAALYTHYEQERNRSVNAHIPSEFWAGPEVLRAMAQYLREPLFVLDVDINNDSHVQRYFYQDYTLRNGDIHEIGCGGALTDADAKLMLGHYARLHVLPVLLVLKRHEGHFYGVNAGDVATKWQAEGDREFATQHCGRHPG
ncbi:hypothetical protein PR003_g14953 [Phytophthora rubi]|nr:hypothetical protein PR003_g14953 [Phytophthora rubi]